MKEVEGNGEKQRKRKKAMLVAVFFVDVGRFSTVLFQPKYLLPLAA
jgi:hypothetical protein